MKVLLVDIVRFGRASDDESTFVKVWWMFVGVLIDDWFFVIVVVIFVIVDCVLFVIECYYGVF